VTTSEQARADTLADAVARKLREVLLRKGVQAWATEKLWFREVRAAFRAVPGLRGDR
jgi:hypothetical protein